VQAVVDYTFNGARRFTTLPERITVFPAPELEIDYELPEAGLVCTVFDLKATVRNVGAGAARGLRLTSGQPRILESSGGAPQSFEIVGVWANGEPLANASMEVALGDPSTGSGQALAPGASGEVVWRIRAAQPGQFTAFTSDYRMLNYQGLALAPSLRAINTTFAPPDDLAFYGCNANPGPYSISGYVVNEDGEPIEGAVVLSGVGPYATTDVNGFYTLTNLGIGTYILSLGNIGPNLSLYFASPPPLPPLRPPCDDLTELECKEALRIYLQSLKHNHPKVIIEQGDETQEADNTIVYFLPPDPIPAEHAFKGAGWLRYVDESDPVGTGTDYSNRGIGWNVETVEDIRGIPNVAGEIERFAVSGVEVDTIVRLDDHDRNDGDHDAGDPDSKAPLDHGTLESAIAQGNCTPLNAWMERIDEEYEFVRDNVPSVRFLILGNEPNHMTDEWNYSAEQYAFVYNCYYQHWLKSYFEPGVERRPPHALFVAGPGHEPGRPNQWDIFLPSLFEHLTDADGFTMHVYGYSVQECRDESNRPLLGTDCGGDQDGNALFKMWLDSIMSHMSMEKWRDKPLIITEYNPGAGTETIIDPVTQEPTRERVPYVNVPPYGWADWFDRTYCWSWSAQENYPNVQLRGLIYYVDEQDSWRNESPWDINGALMAWWPVSLRSDGIANSSVRDDTRRQAWLNLDKTFEGFGIAPEGTPYTEWCRDQQTRSILRDRFALASPIVENIGTEVQPARSNLSIDGIVTGTLGIRGGDDVYYVTEDLEVPAGETLRIEAGTTLVFSASQRMVVDGKLFANGNTVFSIRFISPDEAGWEGIHFQGSASGGWCVGCYLENIRADGVALQVDAPISLQSSLIRDVPAGTAISSTIPLTLSHVIIDYVDTGIDVSGQPSQTYTLSQLTINRCRQGVVNHGQSLALDNSIFTTCDVAVATELSGATAISYTLFDSNRQDFMTENGSQLVQGPGILSASPGFVDFPDDLTLRPDSAAVNAADPQADFSGEPGYNGGRADLGAYGNSWRAPQQPPLDQMGVTIDASITQRAGRPGEIISYTLTVENSGSITDTYALSVISDSPYWRASLAQDYDKAYRFYELAPQEQVSVTVWANIPLTTTFDVSNTLLVSAIGRYGVRDEIGLTTRIEVFQEINGQVVMEAEHFSLNNGRSGRMWLTQSILADYTGPGYTSALPDTDVLHTTSYTTTSPQLQYTMNFTTTATYYLWLRGYAPNAA
jgi:hypothetical protein